MSKIYDNIGDGKKFKDILNDVISEPGIKRMDFCVGYFNLRGWDFIADEVSTPNFLSRCAFGHYPNITSVNKHQI